MRGLDWKSGAEVAAGRLSFPAHLEAEQVARVNDPALSPVARPEVVRFVGGLPRRGEAELFALPPLPGGPAARTVLLARFAERVERTCPPGEARDRMLALLAERRLMLGGR